ncbi:HIRAN domain-containing protein [Paenarthrobacter sp. YAF11_1]|uniref:HIRAN domain-containing protein n=1 Tax=Paenarthrobacter sp. YAF11_1 TaxID=3233074 RepID=UPI003F943638
MSGSAAPPPVPAAESTSTPAVPALRITLSFSPCVEVAGTTTFASEAVAALAHRESLGTRGYYEGAAQLQREPENPADPQAVSVVVDGEKVGYLPSFAAREIALPEGVSHPARYQLHIQREQKLLAKAYVWLAEGQPEWAYSRENPPALTAHARKNKAHADATAMVQEALEGGGERAAQFKRGMVDGVHYLQLIEPIKQLKREGRNEKALVLCYKAIQAAEGDAGGREPAPWYTEQAAIVHRKLGQKEEEIAVLQRWMDRCPKARRDGSRIGERLAKLETRTK